jgi:Fe-S-cluster containining protein
MKTLSELHENIDIRVKAIRDENSDWLCKMGCDGCCHRLAQIPQLTAAEWALFQEGFATLSTEKQQEIRQSVATLSTQSPRSIICPMLDKAAGACLIYAYRPVACRTYGFYVERDKGLYCHDIEASVADGTLNQVVWGNHDTINRHLDKLGDKRDLVAWFEIHYDNIV